MTRTVKNPDVRRSEILKAARLLFQTRTFDKTTMQDVMDALGVAKGTIYYYFSSKEDLLEAVVQDMVDENLLFMQGVVEQSTGSALDRLQRLITAGSMAQENDAILEELHKPGNIALHSRLLGAALQKQAPLYARLVAQGCAEGIFHTANPLEASEFILAAVQVLTDTGIHPWEPQDLERRARALPALIEALLQAPAGSFQFLTPQTQN